nr:CotH kinase family protein [Bacteroidota bacterium]
HTMAIMSCASEQLDNLLNGNQSLHPFGTFEYFNMEGERTTFGYGEYNEHGQDSWVHDQRSIDYISRDECGYNYAIREKLIPLTDRDEFQRIILRAAGDDNYPGIDTSAHLRDFFVQNVAEKNSMNLDVRKGEKGILYCNGDYWGIYGYREKVSDHDFTNYYYDQGKYDIYFLKLWGGSWAEYGGQAAWNDWNDLHNFIKYNDMGDPENWTYVKSRLDYTSLVDYIHINSFVVCSDWINWNVGRWRGTNPLGGHQKWGYVLWDEDATFAHYINYTGVPGIHPYVIPCFPEGLSSDPEEHIVMLNHLLDSPEFYQYYVNRYVDLYNTAFRPHSLTNYLDSIEMKMLPEMPQHVARWGGSVQTWQNNVQKIRNFINNRYGYLPEGFSDCWDLTGPYEVSFDVEPYGSGNMQINSLTPDVPWEGVYFGGIDTKLLALETNESYEFDKWVLNNHTVLPNDSALEVTVSLEEGDHIVAMFKPRFFADSLVINEINYNSASNFVPEDWVEFYNPNEYELDITGWVFKDEDDAHAFEFPENTIIEPLGYLVLCNDTAAFTSLFPDVTNIIGDMGFGLSGNGELIRLFNDEDVMVDTVHYDDTPPWPTEPDGNGPTLELWYPWLDNALAESWRASSYHGTPGAMNSFLVSIGDKSNDKPLTFTIFPNPLTSGSMLKINSDRQIINGEFVLYNLMGHEVYRISGIRSNRVLIERNGLPEGMYVFRFTDGEAQLVGTGKIVVK